MTRYPGEVYFLPPDTRAGGDPKWRRHALMAECPDSSEVATVAYASTQATEASFGAANVLVNPTRTRYRGTGFESATYVYPSRLVSIDPSDLSDMEGKIIDEMHEIREALRTALGLGTGTSTSGLATGSVRGRLVMLHHASAAELGADFGVLVTEPAYSKCERYQILVPILGGEHFEAQDNDVIVTNTPWLESLAPSLSDAFLWTEGVTSIFWDEIQAISDEGSSIDDATMADLETALMLYFQL